MRVYQASRREPEEVISPHRLDSLYFFDNEKSARLYAKEFGYDFIVTAEIEKGTILRTWKPSYASGGKVIRLKPKKTAILIGFTAP